MCVITVVVTTGITDFSSPSGIGTRKKASHASLHTAHHFGALLMRALNVCVHVGGGGGAGCGGGCARAFKCRSALPVGCNLGFTGSPEGAAGRGGDFSMGQP